MLEIYFHRDANGEWRMAGMHIAARGSKAGQLVPCKAASPETCGLGNVEHYANEAEYLESLAEANEAIGAPLKKSSRMSNEQRLAALREKAHSRTEEQLVKMMDKHRTDREAFLRAMETVYAEAYSAWINEKVEQDNPAVKPTAKPGAFMDGVVDATASAMNEGFKNAQRQQLHDSFRRSVRNVLGEYWDANHPQ